MIRRALDHPLRASLVSICVSALTVLAIGVFARPDAVVRELTNPRDGWLTVALVAELASLPAYALAYRRIVRHVGGWDLSARLTVRMVLAGFGTFAVLGGLTLDRRGLERTGAHPRAAKRSILALSLTELATLALAACIAAAVMLLEDASVTGSMLWPWAAGVPVGICVTVWLSRPPRSLQRRLPALTALSDDLKHIANELVRHPQPWFGIGGYFLADILCLYAGLRAVGLNVDAGGLVIAYASGFLLTKRTLPLGGAGIVELLLTVSLVWVGEPLASALAAVVLYRAFNLLLVAALALAARDLLTRTTFDSVQSERSSEAHSHAAP